MWEKQGVTIETKSIKEICENPGLTILPPGGSYEESLTKSHSLGGILSVAESDEKAARMIEIREKNDECKYWWIWAGYDDNKMKVSL